ncbi:MAG TPA: hypothetical protein V6C95_05020 [Coleofasciculaceae cyanobacterium]
MANKPNDENEKKLTKEEKRAKEKRLLKKVICPYCGTEVETLTEPCIVCASKKQLELGENQ